MIHVMISVGLQPWGDIKITITDTSIILQWYCVVITMNAQNISMSQQATWNVVKTTWENLNYGPALFIYLGQIGGKPFFIWNLWVDFRLLFSGVLGLMCGSAMACGVKRILTTKETSLEEVLAGEESSEDVYMDYNTGTMKTRSNPKK